MKEKYEIYEASVLENVTKRKIAVGFLELYTKHQKLAKYCIMHPKLYQG